jgi:DNA polymerase (family 10)
VAPPAPLGNDALAALFDEVSALLELCGDNPHRVRSYASVARTLGGLPRPAAEMLADGTLLEVRGIGEGTAARVRELLETGRLAMLEELRAKVPPGLSDVLRVPGLGPKRAREVWQSLGVTGLEELEYACLENRLRDLKGFGEKTQQKVVEGIGFLKRSRGLRLLSQGRTAAERVLRRLEREDSALRLAVVGSVRRMRPVVRNVDLLATAHVPAALLDAFSRMPLVASVASRDATRAEVVLEDGTSVRLAVVPEDAFPAAQTLRASAPLHAAALCAAAAGRGLRLSEEGLFRGPERLPLEDDRDLYAALGLPWFPPELRESDDLSALPPDDLVAAGDVRGILHAHSTWSDGAYSIREMATRAARSGYSWFAICDHSRTAAYARGLTVERLLEQWAEVDAINAAGDVGIPVLKGVESDVLPDGSLDYPDDVLERFDVVVASVHSAFRQPEAVMTERLVRAVSNRFAHVLGHPTGRLLLGREGYAFDVDRVLEACAVHGTAVECNANPHRLDFDEAPLRAAAARGVPVAIDPDAHDLLGVDDVVYGVGVARRAALRRGDVVNTLSADDFRAWCARKSGKPAPPPLPVPAPRADLEPAPEER